jgi:DNA (cytosine-5)-methyltransferase 1
MRVCSLFSGIGGIDLGFQQAGFDVVWANEFDHDAATTYRVNFGGEHLVEKDIRHTANTGHISQICCRIASNLQLTRF